MRPFLREETGVGVYFRNLLFHLAGIDRTNEYFLFSSSWKDRFQAEGIPPFARKTFRDFRLPVRVVNFFWYNFGCPPLDFFFGKDLDLTHSPTPLILPTKGRKIVSVCDLFFLDYPQKADREAGRYFFKKIRRSLERADGVVTISRFTREALMDRFRLDGDKVRVIYLGLSQEFRGDIEPEKLDEMKLKYNLPEKFILFVGAREPRKNLPRLIDAFGLVTNENPEMGLVLAGRDGKDSGRVRERIRESGIESRVRVLGHLPEKELAILYRLASVFAFPSLCEGFGLPLLEAMAGGLPVAASGVTAIPEIAGEAALFFDPEDAADMADKILRLLGEKDLRAHLAALGKRRILDFDWDRTAEETLDFYLALG